MRLNYAGRTLLSFVSFNLGWWACALGPVYGWAWLGPALLPLWVGLHLYFSPTTSGEALFFVLIAALGFVIDSAFLRLGVFVTGANQLWAPVWLVTMWVLLGLTFESMLVMRRHPLLIFLMGVMSGPLSYFFAEAVDVLRYAQPKWLSMSIHGLFWAGLMSVLFLIRDWSIRLTLKPHPHPPDGGVSAGDSDGGGSGTSAGGAD
jgi:hypothetical protein